MSPTLKTILRWPLWTAQLFTGAKSFADNRLIGSRRLNAMGLHRARLRAAQAMTAWRRRRLASGLSPEDRAAFDRHGYVECPELLPPAEFAAMRDAILGREWAAMEMIQGDTVTRRIAVDGEMLRVVPGLKALLRSPRWRGLLQYVAGFSSEPLYYIQTICTYHRGQGGDPQNIVHADTFHSSMKAWLFLTDVAQEDGPLTYVAGSHRLTPERLDWEEAQALAAPDGLDPLSAKGSLRIASEALTALDLPQPTPFAVPANTLVVADVLGFHARSPATRPSIRVELWAYCRRNPFLPWTGLDLTSLPGIAERRIPLAWWFRQRFGQPYHDVGYKRPDAP